MTKILVVDDEKNHRILYGKELQDEGYEVALAENAGQALESFTADRPLRALRTGKVMARSSPRKTPSATSSRV